MISVLLATYNWPEALQKCLESLASQTDTNFEIIIADDGSGPPTRLLIDSLKEKFPISIAHLSQNNHFEPGD
jgi:glycosyltransferase involved in cell wall biosynthesis